MDGPSGLLRDIVPGSLVAIDSMAVIYRVESSPSYVPIVEPFFTALAAGVFRAVTSVITLMEVAVGPLRRDDSDLASEYEALLLQFPNLTVVDVDRAITRRAAELRAAHRLRPADALQAATGLITGADSLLTNDRTLTRVTDLRVLLLDSYLPLTGGV